MAYFSKEVFTFQSQGLLAKTFGVVSFTGFEALSRCYEFELELVSDQIDLDLNVALKNPATFTIKRDEGDIQFHGILARIEQRQAYQNYAFYRAVLVPKLWWLSLTHHNQVFLNKKLPDILTAVLNDGGLTSLDFELNLGKNYQEWEYVCQYRESHLNFISRWMERRGLYYYFEQGPHREKVILTDMAVTHTPMPHGKAMFYSPPSGLESSHMEEVIHSFVCRQHLVPQKVMLKDYNYLTPSLEITGQALVSPHGRGEVYTYGDHFRTPEEGDELAKIRAEELLCREKLFTGESSVPFMRPGYTFDLEDHFRRDNNQEYLTLETRHEGSQAGYLISGLSGSSPQAETRPFYRNSFTAIPAKIQFRPEHKTEKARFYGSMTAKIDAAGSGQYAELDEQGRYKVILPFDLSGRKNGKASTYLRMVQPYAGSGHGMHFPLHKDTEVLLTFIDGDPDRPIISGAVPNPLNPSLVDSQNQTMAMIQTGGKNKIAFEDKKGGERILLHSPIEDTWVRLGATDDSKSGGGADSNESQSSEGEEEKKDPYWWEEFIPSIRKSGWDQFLKSGCFVNTTGPISLTAGSGKAEFILGQGSVSVVGGDGKAELIVGGGNISITLLGGEIKGLLGGLGISFSLEGKSELTLGPSVELAYPQKWQIDNEKFEAFLNRIFVGKDKVSLSANNTDVGGSEQKVNTSKLDASTQTTKVDAQKTNVSSNTTEVKDSKVDLSNNDLKAKNTIIEVKNTDVGTTTTKVENKTTKVENVTTSVEKKTTKVETTDGVSLDNTGGVKLNNAATTIIG